MAEESPRITATREDPPEWVKNAFDPADVEEWAAATERGDPADVAALVECMRMARERFAAEGREVPEPVSSRPEAAHGTG